MSLLWLLAAMYILEAAAIMASYELVYRKNADKPWLEVIVGTLIWAGPPFLLDMQLDLSKCIFQVILLGSLIVVGGAMMSWIFLVHLNDNRPSQLSRNGGKSGLVAWQEAMLREVEHALDRQAFFVEQLEREGRHLDGLSDALSRAQEAIGQHVEQVSLYRRIGEQTARDLREGRASSYMADKE